MINNRVRIISICLGTCHKLIRNKERIQTMAGSELIALANMVKDLLHVVKIDCVRLVITVNIGVIAAFCEIPDGLILTVFLIETNDTVRRLDARLPGSRCCIRSSLLSFFKGFICSQLLCFGSTNGFCCFCL